MKKTIDCKFSHGFGTLSPNYQRNLNAPKLLSEAGLPDGLVKAYREIQKGNLNFGELAHDLRGTRAGHRFGI